MEGNQTHEYRLKYRAPNDVDFLHEDCILWPIVQVNHPFFRGDSKCDFFSPQWGVVVRGKCHFRSLSEFGVGCCSCVTLLRFLRYCSAGDVGLLPFETSKVRIFE